MNFSGWRPIRIYVAKGQVMVDWARLMDEPLLEPFFQHGIQGQLKRPFHLAYRRQTTLDDLLAWHEASACVMSVEPHHLQLSEPAPVDFLLREALPRGLLSETQV
ncbi:MAG: hypothetical protein F9K35_16580, partial [Burkholderiaceae bacterium]